MRSPWLKVGQCIRLHRGINKYEVCVYINAVAYRESFDFLQDAKDQRADWFRLRDKSRRKPEKRNPDHKPEICRNNTILRMPWTLMNTESLQLNAASLETSAPGAMTP